MADKKLTKEEITQQFRDGKISNRYPDKFDICPYCGADDVSINDHRPEIEEDGKEMVCQDMECLTCLGIWTIEYRPVQWFGYDKDGNFDETPRPLNLLRRPVTP